MKRVILIIPIILFGFLAIYNIPDTKSGCNYLAEVYWRLLFTFLTIAYSLILSLILLFLKIFKKIRFDFLPLISLSIVVLIFLSIQYFSCEKYKRNIYLKAEMNDCDPAEGCEYIIITLRENKKYSLRKSGGEYGCIENGEYLINNDTLIINRQSENYIPDFEYERFIIDSTKGIMLILKTTNIIDSTKYLEII